ncbi:MAG: T9SS type A sorting domain-containing protein [Bacteroidia bacterium]
MKLITTTRIYTLLLLAISFFQGKLLPGQAPVVHVPDISIKTLVSLPSTQEVPVRLGKLPGGNLIYSTLYGEIFEINNGSVQLLFDPEDHGLEYISGMAIHQDQIYICGSVVQEGDTTMIGYVMKGTLPAGPWETIVESVPYFLGKSFNDHRFSELTVDPGGEYLYLHSGTRTNAGEVHELSGVPNTLGLRDQPIRGKLLKIPVSPAQKIILQNDSTWLQTSGYLYAEGLRHMFCLAWDKGHALYGGSNSDRRDVGEGFYRIEAGTHLGFPWWIGGKRNPLQFGNYDPTADKLLPSGANNQGYYNPDTLFPAMPEGIDFVQPYKNIGPDADKFRDSITGAVMDASNLGLTITTFSGHRSPTGLVFDTLDLLPAPFRGDGFMVSYNNGGNLLSGDGRDLLHIRLLNDDSLSATRMISGFIRPIDVLQDSQKLFVLDYGNSSGTGRKIYEITFGWPTGIRNDLRKKPFTLYPNPAGEKIRIEMTEPGKIRRIQLIDNTGKVWKAELGADFSINLSGVAAGKYILNAELEDGTIYAYPFIRK